MSLIRAPWARAAVLGAATFLYVSAAPAAIESVFSDSLNCEVIAGGVRACQGIVELPDRDEPLTGSAIRIDVNLFLPGDTGSDQPMFPIIGEFHGWGGAKLGGHGHFTGKGYAYLSISDRGWGNSCGGMDFNRLASPADCINGYNRLLDTRYEVHDVQTLFGMLADEGIIDPNRIGVTGGSYGGGMSMALAALNDRTMPVDYEAGDALEPWTSPNGIPMKIAAAAPDIPWTDLAYSLQPNGATLDYVAEAPYLGPNGDGRVGIMKQSYVSGFYGIGLAVSNYAPAGYDEDADLHKWYALVSGGEPYDQNPLAADIIDELTIHHSSYYIDDSRAPAPLFISNGFTDDIFPVDEALRFYNKTMSKHPDADIRLFFSDHGHARGQNKGEAASARIAARDAWLDHYVLNQGEKPANNVTVWTQTCGSDPLEAFTADNWASLPGSEIVIEGPAMAVIAPYASDPQSAQAYDPIGGGGACATASGDDKPGFASYRSEPVTEAVTLAGSPTIIADILNLDPNSQIAARLVDVDPDTNDAVLVARGLFRPQLTLGADPVRMVFQLHPNAYKFKTGHVAKLELMPHDAPYGRVSNGQAPITISNLEARLPIIEAVGTSGSVVVAPKFLPAGYELAPDYLPAAPDADGDGVPDSQDDCPDEFGSVDNAGCPDTAGDSDGDGVADDVDNCPNEAGPANNAGCPLPDADGDGIADVDDDCPGQAGPSSATPGENGCPVADADGDGDGVADSVDACPDTAGTDARGCPVSSGAVTIASFTSASNPASNDVTNGPVVVTFSVDASSSDPNAGVLGYTYYFGDGEREQSETNSAVHSYSRAGDYTVTVIVTDDAQNTAVESLTLPMTTTLSIDDTAPVEAVLSVDTGGNSIAPVTAVFDASGSNAPVRSIYTFDFGDGSDPVSGTDQLRRHVYAAAGTYTATVTVQHPRDPTNTSTATANLTVKPVQETTAVFVVSPTEAEVGEVIKFDARDSIEVDPIVSFTFDFDDGTVVVRSVAEFGEFAGFTTHSYERAGVYTPSVVANTSSGAQSTAKATLRVKPASGPRGGTDIPDTPPVAERPRGRASGSLGWFTLLLASAGLMLRRRLRMRG